MNQIEQLVSADFSSDLATNLCVLVSSDTEGGFDFFYDIEVRPAAQ